jgi:hypothetical protein
MTTPKVRILHETAQQVATNSAVWDPRFWEKTRVEGDCLVWTGYRDRQSYGLVGRKEVQTSPILAHRYAWYLTHGEVDPKAVIRHTCDNPPCVLPAHLLSGTQADNIADRQARGRHRPGRLHGEQHSQAKLSDSEVLWIRRAATFHGWRNYQLADEFGISRSAVSRIVLGRNWTHLRLDGIEDVA